MKRLRLTKMAMARRMKTSRAAPENLESWLAWREAAGRPVPGYVDEELRGYLECGLLCFGFASAWCAGCGQGFVIAFSCKGRGVCPSCNGRHMAQAAAHLVDHVIPPVPGAVAALTKIFLTEIERTALGRPSRSNDSPGAAVQTAGSLASVTCSPGTRRPTGSGGVAGGSPRGQGPMASSSSHRLSSSTGSPISSTSCEKPSRRWRSGTSASGATPVRVAMRAMQMPRAAATLTQSPARTTPPGLPGRNSWPGWGRSFPSCARRAAVPSGSSLSSRSRARSGRFSPISANRSSRRQSRRPGGHPPTGASLSRLMTTAKRFRCRPTRKTRKRGTSLTSRSSARKCLWTWLRKCH